MYQTRNLDLSMSVPNTKDFYQQWATNSSSYAKKLRATSSVVISKEEGERQALLRWNSRRCCDLEGYRLSHQVRLTLLRSVRMYHAYVSGAQNGAWELLDSNMAIKFQRENGKDTVGIVQIVCPGGITETFHGVNGDHMNQILELMIKKNEK